MIVKYLKSCVHLNIISFRGNLFEYFNALDTNQTIVSNISFESFLKSHCYSSILCLFCPLTTDVKNKRQLGNKFWMSIKGN